MSPAWRGILEYRYRYLLVLETFNGVLHQILDGRNEIRDVGIPTATDGNRRA
jgi:hypothetical protein